MENLQAYESDEDSCSESRKDCIKGKDAQVLDFFNLKPLDHIEGNHQDKWTNYSKTEKSKGETTLEVPESDFWNRFDPSENNLEESVPTYHSERERFHAHFSGNDNKSSSSKSFQSVKRKLDSLIPEDSIDIKKERFSGSGERLAIGEKRKIFFIHSKIMPGLSSKSACKCTSAMDSNWPCHENAINRLSWNKSDFSHLIATAGMDSLIKIWNVWSKLDKCVSVLHTHSKAVRTFVWGSSGKTIISASYDKTAAISDIETGSVLCRFDHQGFVTACAKHPSNNHCIVTGSDNIIQMWDQRRPSVPYKVFHFREKIGQIQDLLFIQDGQELLSCSDVVARDSADKTIMAWDVRSGVVLSNQVFQERYTCTRLKLHQSNSHFLAQTQGGYIAVFSTQRPYKMDKSKRFDGHQMQGYNIGFDLSHDGKFVYSGSADGGIHCYDYRSGRLIKKCTANKNAIITDVASHPVLSSVVATCSWGGNLNLWQ